MRHAMHSQPTIAVRVNGLAMTIRSRMAHVLIRACLSGALRVCLGVSSAGACGVVNVTAYAV